MIAEYLQDDFPLTALKIVILDSDATFQHSLFTLNNVLHKAPAEEDRYSMSLWVKQDYVLQENLLLCRFDEQLYPNKPNYRLG